MVDSEREDVDWVKATENALAATAFARLRASVEQDIGTRNRTTGPNLIFRISDPDDSYFAAFADHTGRSAVRFSVDPSGQAIFINEDDFRAVVPDRLDLKVTPVVSDRGEPRFRLEQRPAERSDQPAAGGFGPPRVVTEWQLRKLVLERLFFGRRTELVASDRPV